MSETERKHTPGPWVLAHRSGQAVIRGPSTECLATFPYAPCEGFGLTDVFEVAANAHLAVAAPDMLDALRTARATILQLKNARWSECEGSDEDWVRDIDAAIAKATGTTLTPDQH